MPEEPKVWYLLDALSSAVMHYKSLGLTHGDVQPRTVHVTPGSEVVLIDNMLLHPKGRDLLSKISQNPAYRGPLSPLQLAALSNKQREANHDPFASEVWALGLTALAYAACGDLTAFYDWDKKTFRDNVLEFELNRLKKKGYSDSLVQVFRCLLAKEESARPTVEELHECLSKTEKMKIYPDISNAQTALPAALSSLPLHTVQQDNRSTGVIVSAPPTPVVPGSPVRTRDPNQFSTEIIKVDISHLTRISLTTEEIITLRKDFWLNQFFYSSVNTTNRQD